MTRNWLIGTTAVALLIGAGAVTAQTQTDRPQKGEEGSQARTPSHSSKDADRPAAGEQRSSDRLKERAAQPEPKAGEKEPQRGEAAAPSERKQAQDRQEPRDAKQPAKQSQEQQGRGEHAPTSPTQQSQDEQKGRDARQSAEPKQRQGRDEQPKPDNRALDEKKPADTKQQQGQRQPERDRNDNQTAQPSATSPNQQGGRPSDVSQDRQRGQDTGQVQDQSKDQSTRREGRSSVTVNDEQRTQIIDRLRRERAASNENINIRVNIGERLPPRVRPRPLPPDIVRIAPQYRAYEYTVVDNRITIVNPRTREVVDVLDEPGPAAERTSRERDRVVITREQGETLRQAARSSASTVGSSSSSGSLSDSSCLRLQPVPEDMVRANPELGSYRYLAIGDQVVLVDPRQQKIVQVLD